jgi:hypothetical protein
MTRDQVQAAADEAKRFLKWAGKVLTDGDHAEGRLWASKNNGSLKRASLDLTRALAEMRKP